MNKCVLIICMGNLSNENLQEFLKKEARKNHIEGTVHSEDGKIRIIINGTKESIDQFIDALYNNSAKYDLADIEVEPFYKHKDFRGAFRIIQ
jgi:acylphosphatase